jgi:hypothetical protein
MRLLAFGLATLARLSPMFCLRLCWLSWQVGTLPISLVSHVRAVVTEHQGRMAWSAPVAAVLGHNLMRSSITWPLLPCVIVTWLLLLMRDNDTWLLLLPMHTCPCVIITQARRNRGDVGGGAAEACYPRQYDWGGPPIASTSNVADR